MARTLPMPPPGFEDLTTEEKIDYVSSLWDSIAANPDDVPVPEWHLRILEERIARHEAHPEEAISWEEFERKLLDRRSRRGTT